MAAIQPPLFIGVNGVIGADELGLPFRDIMGEGVLTAFDLDVDQRAAGANMSVDVSAGAAWVKGDDDANAQPTYRVRNDATVNVAIAGADASKPRIDRVVARVYDQAFAGASLTWDIEVITGTPTTGATLTNLSGAAAVPNTALLLANVLVPAAASSIVTADIGDVRPYATVGKGSALSSGAERAYDQATSNPAITHTSSGTADSVIAGSSHNYDGTPVMVEFYTAGVVIPSGSGTFRIGLFESGTLLCVLAEIQSPAASTMEVPVLAKTRLTPTPGLHQYDVKAWVGGGTVSIAGLAASGYGPAYLRITKA